MRSLFPSGDPTPTCEGSTHHTRLRPNATTATTTTTTTTIITTTTTTTTTTTSNTNDNHTTTNNTNHTNHNHDPQSPLRRYRPNSICSSCGASLTAGGPVSAVLLLHI